MTDLQAAVTLWQAQRFPLARMEHVALKACEEVGELASAILGHCAINSATGSGDVATGSGDVAAEAADVVICLYALLGRWFPDVNLEDEIRAKLDVLTDPASGHRSALPA